MLLGTFQKPILESRQPPGRSAKMALLSALPFTYLVTMNPKERCVNAGFSKGRTRLKGEIVTRRQGYGPGQPR